ncbi:MAG: site-specific DNA-methyltransferase [Halobacteriales archaeon]|nr:site-specific DNA-methyltransferase [Halobacteriales archaeon]
MIESNEVPEGQLNSIINEDCIEGMKEIPNNSIDLIIADPPYFKTVNQTWDYNWKTKEEYLKWCEEWVEEVARVGKINSTFYLFGYIRTLSYLVPKVEDLEFELNQQIVVDKGMQSVGGRATKNYKMFPNTTEEILFFTSQSRPYVKKLLNKKKKKLGYTSKEMNEMLDAESAGGGVWSIYAGDNIMGKLPPESKWEQLRDILNIDIPYEEVAPTFNIEMGITNVWSDIDFYKGERKHPTQKPRELIKRLIRASSNEGDTILAPFVGGGTTAVAAKELDRNFIGFEIDEEYCQTARKRTPQERLSDF